MKFNPTFHYKAHGEEFCRTCRNLLFRCFCRPGETRRIQLTPADPEKMEGRITAPVRREMIPDGWLNSIVYTTPDGEFRWVRTRDIPKAEPLLPSYVDKKHAEHVQKFIFKATGGFVARPDGECAEVFELEPKAVGFKVVLTEKQRKEVIAALECRALMYKTLDATSPAYAARDDERQANAEALHVLCEKSVEVDETGEEVQP